MKSAISCIQMCATVLLTAPHDACSVKNPVSLDTKKICCTYPQIRTGWFYDQVMCPKDADEMANSLDPDLLGSVSENLGTLQYYHIPLPTLF